MGADMEARRMSSADEEVLCDVCCQNAGEVMPSGMAPVSYARCPTCRDAGIELLGVVCYHLYLVGGPSQAQQSSHADWWKTVKSFDDGSYIGWKEICEVYPKYAAEFEEEEKQ